MMGERVLTKAILIIDLPMMCAECPMFTWASRDNYKDGFCTHSHKLVKFDLRPLDCPLKPMPQKKEETFAYWIGKGCNDAESYINGWNACLEEITGETE